MQGEEAKRIKLNQMNTKLQHQVNEFTEVNTCICRVFPSGGGGGEGHDFVPFYQVLVHPTEISSK